MNRTLNLLAAGLFALTLPGLAAAQAKSSDEKPAEPRPSETQSASRAARMERFEADRIIKTYYLSHTLQQNDANEILIALRNTLDTLTKLYLIASQNAIVIAAPPDQQALAQRIIDELDRPKKTFRLTFTLAESDGGKRSGIQHFSIVVVAGQRTILKQGSKVPVMTGATNDPQQTQFQYLDIGMNFDATLEYTPGGLFLKSKVEQSSLADEHLSGPLAAEPIVRQTALEGMSALIPGKPLTLGSVDVTGSTRHIDIEVVAEPIS